MSVEEPEKKEIDSKLAYDVPPWEKEDLERFKREAVAPENRVEVPQSTEKKKKIPQPSPNTPDETVLKTDPPMTRKQVKAVIWLLSGIFAILFYSNILASPTPLIPTRWAYVIQWLDDEKFHESMQKMGGNGWELVSARRATNNDKFGYEMIFKRPGSVSDMELLINKP